MKRSINTHSRNSFITSLFVFILLILPNNAVAVNHIFEEDFSSGKGDWVFIGANWRNWGTTGIEVVDHSLSIQDGRLVSNRFINDTYIWDHAYQPTTLENGVWEFNAQQDRYTTLPNDSSNPYEDYAWQFELTQQDWDWDEKTTSTLIASWIVVQFRDRSSGENTIIIEEGDAKILQEGSSAKVYARADNFMENGVDYTFRIVKNETAISVFINEVKIVEHKLAYTFTSFNYFGIGTARPISFDNFRVAKDLSSLEGDTSSIPVKDDTSIPQEDSSDDGFITTTNIAITLGTFTLLGLSYKFYFSKKKSLKI